MNRLVIQRRKDEIEDRLGQLPELIQAATNQLEDLEGEAEGLKDELEDIQNNVNPSDPNQ